MYYLKLLHHLLFSILFSITVYHLLYYINLLPSLVGFTTQNATLTCRQAIYYSLLSSSGGTQSGNHKVTLCCVLTLQLNSTLSTDKPSRMCVLFLQSTPPQNWILLSVYQNRSGSLYQDLCYTCVLSGYFSDNIWYISSTCYTH